MLWTVSAPAGRCAVINMGKSNPAGVIDSAGPSLGRRVHEKQGDRSFFLVCEILVSFTFTPRAVFLIETARVLLTAVIGSM